MEAEARHADRIRMTICSEDDMEGTAVRRRAIVAGYGPVGRAVSYRLEQAGFEVTIVERNGRTVDQQVELGRAVVLGDVAESRVLSQAGVACADALILTIPNEDDVVRACAAARRLSGTIFISARTNHMSYGMLASQAGADDVTVQEVVTAHAMEGAVLRGLGERPAEAMGEAASAKGHVRTQ